MLVRLKTMDNRDFAQTFSGHFNLWTWISDCFAERFECDADEVHEDQDEYGLVTVRGEPVGWIERETGWEVLGVG